MKTIRVLLLIIFASFMFGSLFLTSCKEDVPPKAVIYVYKLDLAGNELPVRDCKVTLNPPADATQPDLLEYTSKPLLTDYYGKVEYEFNYEGIIPVIAEKGDGEASCGQGVIVLKMNEVYEESIRLSACYN